MLAGMLTDETANGREGIVLADDADSIGKSALTCKRNVSGNVHVCGALHGTGDRCKVGCASALFNM